MVLKHKVIYSNRSTTTDKAEKTWKILHLQRVGQISITILVKITTLNHFFAKDKVTHMQQTKAQNQKF